MRFAAIIPARGGSKRLPGKNVAMVGGVSLVGGAIIAARDAGVPAYVSTDDDEIEYVARLHGADTIRRPAALATDTASTESVMGHALRHMGEVGAVVLLQPTSPLRTATHVREACALLVSSGADSVCSVRLDPHAHFVGRSYAREGWREFRPFRPRDWRPRTQDARELCVENGAVYVTRRASWDRTGNRIGGTVAEYRMSEDDSIDIDCADDLERARDAWARRERRATT